MHGLHVLAGIVALVLVMGRIVASSAAFRKSTFRSDRDLLALHGSFVALSASSFAHQAVSVWEGEGL